MQQMMDKNAAAAERGIDPMAEFASDAASSSSIPLKPKRKPKQRHLPSDEVLDPEAQTYFKKCLKEAQEQVKEERASPMSHRGRPNTQDKRESLWGCVQCGAIAAGATCQECCSKGLCTACSDKRHEDGACK